MSLISLCRCLQQHSESRGFYWPETWGVGQAVIYPWCSTTVWGKILLKRYRPLLTVASAGPEPTMPFSRKTRQVWNQGRLTFSKVETRLFIFFPSSTFKIQMKAARSHFFIWGFVKKVFWELQGISYWSWKDEKHFCNNLLGFCMFMFGVDHEHYERTETVIFLITAVSGTYC